MRAPAPHRLYGLGMMLGLTCLLTGCHGVAGNVIPQTGPSMETVYDEMGVSPAQSVHASTQASSTMHTSIDQTNNLPVDTQVSDTSNHAESDLSTIRQTHVALPTERTSFHDTTASSNVFHKLPNPELKLYIYPHLAGTDEIPIPGYYTVFSAYDKTHYALPNDMPH